MSDFDSMQSVKFTYQDNVDRGWAHNALITYALCFVVITMSGVALFVNAAKVEQTQRIAKQHP